LLTIENRKVQLHFSFTYSFQEASYFPQRFGKVSSKKRWNVATRPSLVCRTHGRLVRRSVLGARCAMREADRPASSWLAAGAAQSGSVGCSPVDRTAGPSHFITICCTATVRFTRSTSCFQPRRTDVLHSALTRTDLRPNRDLRSLSLSLPYSPHKNKR